MKVTIYSTKNSKEPFIDWINSIKDKKTSLRINNAILRIEEFDLMGDYKPVQNGIFEIRLHFGAGYRIYFIFLGEDEILLLNGGDKSFQSKDIKKAKQYLEELCND